MMILADFSKAFDTICFRNLITKMSKLGFSRDFNYVMHCEFWDSSRLHLGPGVIQYLCC